MATQIPKNVAESELSLMLQDAGLKRISQGKVRDTFALLNYPNLLAVLATNRISIFDFVLPALVENKGKILTGLTIYWLTKVFKQVNHHLVAYGRDIDKYLPEELRNNELLRGQMIIVKKVSMLPVECIVRGYLTGSGWKSYQEKGSVCGIKLPDGLHDGSKLPDPIFTPTTKAIIGHDVHLNTDEVVTQYGRWIQSYSINLYLLGAAYAAEMGIIVADTKFELGDKILADEVLTPDSSRFWLKTEWEEAIKEEKSPSGYDKQPVREWGKTVFTPFEVTGLNKLRPENSEHVKFVDNLTVPQELLDETAERYYKIIELLTGNSLKAIFNY